VDQLSGLQHLEAATTYRGDACSTAEAMSLYMIVYARNARTCNCARTCIIQGIRVISRAGRIRTVVTQIQQIISSSGPLLQ
jgi:hypothetical protein